MRPAPTPRRGHGAALIILFLAMAALLSASGAARAEGPATTHPAKPYFTDAGQLSYASFLMEDGDYEAAAREFSRLIEEFPTSPLLPRAQLGLGEAYFGAGRYDDAAAQLRLFLTNFSESPLAERAAERFVESRSRLKSERSTPDPVPPSPRRIRPEELPGTGGGGLRAVQVMFFDGRTYGEIGRELERLRTAGVDTVIVRAFHNRGDRYYPLAASMGASGGPGVYFPTDHSPVVSPILPDLIDLAHERGLRVFAWMTTRYADYGLEDRRDLACIGYDLDTGGLERCKGLDLFDPEAVGHIVDLYRDLARLDIDGILFQDDLVLRHTEGFGADAERLFEARTGRELRARAMYRRAGNGGVHYTPLFWRWASFKNGRLLEVADEVRREVRRVNPDVEFALNLMYENLTNPPYALAWLSQDLTRAVESGFDYYSVMAYHRQMADELGRDPESVGRMIEEMVRVASAKVDDPSRVLIKIQTVDWTTGEPLADREVVSLIRRVREAGRVSLAVVPYRQDFPFTELAGTPRVALGPPPGEPAF